MTFSRRLFRRTWVLAVAVVLSGGCVTTQLPPVSQAGAAFEPLPDERELWREARGEESQLRAAVYLYDDPQLSAYLQDVVDRLTPSGMAANPHLRYQVSVIDAPELNAFAYPHGALYVHSGLLARLENEDQLATLLGHEMSHVEGRHMLRQRRALHNRELGFSIASIALHVALDNAEAELWWDGDYGEAFLAGVLGEMFLGLGLDLAFTASVNGYGRDLEREADAGGIDKLADAGYRLGEAPRFYERLRDSARATPGGAVNFFFGSHPRLQRRVEVTRGLVEERGGVRPVARLTTGPDDEGEPSAAWVSTTSGSTVSGSTASGTTDLGADGRAAAGGPGGAGGSAQAAGAKRAAATGDLSEEDRRFRLAMAPVVRDQGFWHLAEGRLEEAEEHFRRARTWAPRDAGVYLLQGQLRLAQSDEAPSPEEKNWLRADAGRAFLEAIRLDPDLPEPHRDLGLMYYEDGQPAAACREFGFYLELVPEAPDADWVRGFLADLEPLGVC